MECPGFWNHLLATAEVIEASTGSLEELHGHLLALEEGFAGIFDPGNHYSEYVAILLCRSIRRRLADSTAGQAE